MQPGEYTQPLQRTNFVFCPLLNGYTTARLGVQNPLFGTITGTWGTIPDWQITGVFENIGATAATVQLVQTPSIISGPRTYVGNPVVLQPLGRKTVQFQPMATYLEISCTGGGPAQLRLQLSSKIELTLEGFNKLDPLTGGMDPVYPWTTVEPNWPVFTVP